MPQADPLPDDQRCKRTDGRDWRCKRPVKEGKLLCEIHFAQVRLRNGRIKVPDALKLQRSNRTSNNKIPPVPASSDGQIRVNGREHLERKSKSKRKRSDAAEDLADETAQRKAEEVLTALAKGNKEKTKRKNSVSVAGDQSGEEITRELPFGRMAIAPMPAKPIANAASPPVKLGLETPSNYRLVDRKFRSKNAEQPPVSTLKVVPFAENKRRKTRVTSVKNGRRKCHWCQKARNVSLNECLSCNKSFFCSDCIKKRSLEAQEVKLRCPVCSKTCECPACLASHPKDAKSEENFMKQCKSSKYLHLHYMINLVLPILEQINDEQRVELEMEAQLKEQSLSEVEVQQVEMPEKKQISCNKCSSVILDMHRSCLHCSYNLCLSCCQETRDLMVQDAPSCSRKKSSLVGDAHTDKKVAKSSNQNVGLMDSDSAESSPSSRAYSGNLICPSMDRGGCTNRSSILDLRCVFPLNYTRDLEISVKEIILSDESLKISNPSLHCSICSSMGGDGNKKELLEASGRKHPGDNFLYCPSIRGNHDILLVHFQKHWRNCHPIIFHDLLEEASDLNWDPLVMFSTYLNMELSRCENGSEGTSVTNCKDWYKVQFCSKENYNGLLTKLVQSKTETLKLSAKLSSSFCQKLFSAYYAEISKNLPLQEYMDPSSGLLNLSAKLAEDSHVPEFSPHIHITCSNSEEIQKGECVNALCYHSYDLVNILVHASDLSPSTDHVDKIRMLVRKKNMNDIGGSNCPDLDNGSKEDTSDEQLRDSTAKDSDSETESDTPLLRSRVTYANQQKSTSEMNIVEPAHSDSSTSEKSSGKERSCVIQWDVFRRQDTPKILEYIQRHSDEFSDPPKEAIDPILGGSIFLDSAQKLMLKHEFKIEPWTFSQKLGEAVLIPAGCLYQMKNLMSCVNVVLGFISPENASECIKLADKLQDLPTNSNSKASKVEVEKMIINKISKAIEEIRNEPRTQ